MFLFCFSFYILYSFSTETTGKQTTNNMRLRHIGAFCLQSGLCEYLLIYKLLLYYLRRTKSCMMYALEYS
uniref:Secreted protein n=1 Tax=Anopheles darlingi TaxID=43151 RepID=A0A2M4D7Y0_ANODA